MISIDLKCILRYYVIVLRLRHNCSSRNVRPLAACHIPVRRFSASAPGSEWPVVRSWISRRGTRGSSSPTWSFGGAR